MPRCQDYNYKQNAMVIINSQEQIQLGTFEYAVHYLVDNKFNLSLFDADFKKLYPMEIILPDTKHRKTGELWQVASIELDASVFNK